MDSEVEQIALEEQQPTADWKMPQTLADAEERKKQIRQHLAQLDQAETDHLHPGEPQARVMKTREGARLAYNAQAVVDHDSDLIVAADVSGDQTDHEQLVPMLQTVKDTFGTAAEQTVADAGYASGAQFERAERRHLPVLVATQQESEKGPYAKSQFTYDRERDVYVCPRAEPLTFERVQPVSTGKPQPRRVYRCHNDRCPVRGQCSRDKKGRTIKRLPTEDAFARQIARQDAADKRTLMSLRKEIVEHIFGIAKAVDGFWRFTVRGLQGAQAQWVLECLAINLRKLAPAWRMGRLQLRASGA